MNKYTVAKKTCQCHICGATINEGQRAQWFEKVSTGHGEWSGKAYTVSRWKLICESGCGERLQAKEVEVKSNNDTLAAQHTVDTIRNSGAGADDIQGLIDYYLQKGINVH